VKKELMKKMAMPSKKAPEIEADMDLESLSLDDEPSEADMEMEGEEDLLAGEEAAPSNEMLADIADEELLAEVKLRGLSLEDLSETGADEEEDMAEGEMEDEEMDMEDELA
jgi:hypothetical protein